MGITFWLWLLILVFSPLTSLGEAQSFSSSGAEPRRPTADAAEAEDRTIPTISVSDIHFDPFHDPAKVKQLVKKKF